MADKRRIWIGIAGGVLLGLVAGAVWYWQGSDPSVSSARRKAPQFNLPDSAGQKHSLEEFRGKWVMLHFWAAWCPPCLPEIPNWLTLARKMSGGPERDRIRFVAVSTDPRWEDALKILPVQDLPQGTLSLLDASTKVAEEFGTYQFPETYLLNPRLEIVAKWVGAQEWGSPRMEAELKKAVTSDPADLEAR